MSHHKVELCKSCELKHGKLVSSEIIVTAQRIHSVKII
jgi:hypothetical protein